MRVIILEYDALLCDLIALSLKRNHYEPVVCEDPILVRDMITRRKPDVMIIDTSLPYQNGIDLLRELRDENLLAGIYVVMLSSLGFSCIVNQAVEAGANDFLLKPVNLDVLVAKIDHLKNKPMTQPLSAVPVNS